MSFILNDPNKAILSIFQKGKAAQEGEIRTHSGVKVKKQGGRWVPVSEGKEGSKKDDTRSSNKGKKEEFSPSDHGKAQLSHMKSIIDSDPKKAYEMYKKLKPEQQSVVPQEVVDKMVKEAHTDEKKEQTSWDDIGKQKSEEDNDSKSNTKVEDAKKATKSTDLDLTNFKQYLKDRSNDPEDIIAHDSLEQEISMLAIKAGMSREESNSIPWMENEIFSGEYSENEVIGYIIGMLDDIKKDHLNNAQTNKIKKALKILELDA